MVTIRESGLFEAKEEMSEVDKIYALIEDTDVGLIITYSDLERVLGRDFRDNRNPWYKAVRRYQRDHPGRGTFATVANVGYRKVADWQAIQGNVEDKRKRAARQIRRAKGEASSADRSKMSKTEQDRQTQVEIRLGMVESALRSVRKELTLGKRKTENTDAEVIELRRRLEELEATHG